MLQRKSSPGQGKSGPSPFSNTFIEALEERQFLSATALHFARAHHHSGKHATKHATATSNIVRASTSTASTTSTFSTADDSGDHHGKRVNTIAFDLTPSAVQTGLDALASTDGLSAPATTQIVQLGNSNGVETYSIEYTTSGTQSRLTVDQNGNPITAPTKGTVTWADLNGSGSNANAAAAAEITAIATAQGLTAPTATTVINTSTTAAGTVYSVRLSPSSTSTGEHEHGQNISVDANGNPVGNQSLPFSVLPTAIQGFINANLPTGATALDPASTQPVNVRTIDGVVTYSTTFTTSGTVSTVTVDLAGTLETLTDPTTTTFSLIPSLAQTELQSLATAEGVTTAIASTQNVNVYTELNGTIVYAVTLSATDSSSSQTYEITIASDALGNPTVPPGRGGFGDRFGGGFGGGCDGGGGFGGHDGAGFGGFGDGPDNGFSGFARFGG